MPSPVPSRFRHAEPSLPSVAVAVRCQRERASGSGWTRPRISAPRAPTAAALASRGASAAASLKSQEQLGLARDRERPCEPAGRPGLASGPAGGVRGALEGAPVQDRARHRVEPQQVERGAVGADEQAGRGAGVAAGRREQAGVLAVPGRPPQQGQVHHRVDGAGPRRARVADRSECLEVVAARVEAPGERPRRLPGRAVLVVRQQAGLAPEHEPWEKQEAEVVGGPVPGPGRQQGQPGPGQPGGAAVPGAGGEQPHHAVPEAGGPVAVVVHVLPPGAAPVDSEQPPGAALGEVREVPLGAGLAGPALPLGRRQVAGPHLGELGAGGCVSRHRRPPRAARRRRR